MSSNNGIKEGGILTDLGVPLHLGRWGIFERSAYHAFSGATYVNLKKLEANSISKRRYEQTVCLGRIAV